MIRNAARSFDRLRARQFWLLAIVLFLALAISSYWPSWPGDPNTLPSCPCGDTVQQSWFLYWVPWALLHGHNPLFTSWINWPVGANLAQNTEMPLLGLLAAPLSLTVGPVASFNLFMWLACPLSALSMAWVVRRWTTSNSASLVTGLIYGFSQYVVGQGLGHLNLAFVPLPPLIVAAFFEVLVRQLEKRRRWGIWLGVLIVAQYLISSEILATTGLFVLIGGAFLAIARRQQLSRDWVHRALEGLIPAAVIAIVVLGYPVYFLVSGPEHLTVPVQGAINNYRADLLAPFLPTSDALLAPSRFRAIADQFTAGTRAENGSYLGIPLCLAALVVLIRYRRDVWIGVAGSLAAIAFVLSLGPRLVIDRHLSAVPLPFALFTHLPVLNNILASRFSLYVTFFTSTLIGLGIARSLTQATAAAIASPLGGHVAIPGFFARRFGDIAVAIAAITIVATLLPRWPIPTYGTAIPPFFSSAQVSRIPVDSQVLTYPFAVSPYDHAMLWQTKASMRFKLIGGYAINPGADHGVSPWPPLLTPTDVQGFLGWEEYNGPIGYILQSPPTIDHRLIRDVATYLAIYHVSTVVVDLTVAPNVPTVLSVFTRAIGRPPILEDGADVWFDVTETGPK